MTMALRKLLQQSARSAVAALGIGLVASSAYATDLCHNIGGPRDLGANCDATGCTFTTEEGQTITLPVGWFFGILIGGPQFKAPLNLANNSVQAHIAHGDGIALAFYDPPLHLASDIGPHKASNVDCAAIRIVPQPPDHGN